MMRVIAAMRGEDDVDVEEEHLSTPGVELEPFVERLQKRAVGAQIDTRARPVPASEHRHGGAFATIGGLGELSPEGGVHHIAEGLTPLARAALGRGKQLVGDRHGGAHDANNTASCASRSPPVVKPASVFT
jgi:hypothetical protein